MKQNDKKHKTVDLLKTIYIYTYIYIYIYKYMYIYILFSFHSLIFHSKIHKHPACKMNRDEQGGAGRKFEVLSEHTF